jgi:hypothetical protein
MDLERLKKIQEIVSGFAALGGGVLAGFWVYTKYVLERSLLPPVQFDINCNPIGRQGLRTVLDIVLHLKNVGTSALVATDIRVDVLYLDAADEPGLFADSTRSTFARLRFPHSLRKELLSRDKPSVMEDPTEGRGREPKKDDSGESRGILLLQHDTFVQPGVDQIYAVATTVPASATFVLVWSSFRYAQRPSAGQRVLLHVARALGLIQYSLTHVRKPHTVERIFFVGTSGHPSHAGSQVDSRAV